MPYYEDEANDTIKKSDSPDGNTLGENTAPERRSNTSTGQVDRVSRRELLQSVAATAGLTTFGVRLASGSDGPRQFQVSQRFDLCGTVPSDHHMAFIEDASTTRGRGFYMGTNNENWAFTGWLTQTQPEGKAKGYIRADKDASKPSHRHLQVWQPSDLKQHYPGDDHLAFVEDGSHERGRGFYAGGSNGKWWFVGWLDQTKPDQTVSGSVSPGSGTALSNRLIQVPTPGDLQDYEPTNHSLAFIEDMDHEHGRGFYTGTADGSWTFTGWLAQTRPSTTEKDTLNPTGVECNSSGTDDSSTSSSVLSTDSVANGAWKWNTDEVDPYDDWLSDSIQVASIGHGKNKWSYFIDFDTRGFADWIKNGDEDRVFLPHIPMVSREEKDSVGRATTLRNLADGEYNQKFRLMAQRFADDGFDPSNIVLRVGNEFNIKAQPYSPVGTDVSPDTWAKGYRQIVDTCRDVLGEDLKTVWAPLIGATQQGPQETLDHYPGADYAMVGGDIYDKAPAYEKPGQAPEDIDYDTASDTDRKTVQEYVWNEKHLQGYKWGGQGPGLNHIAELSSQVDRPLAIVEWGLTWDDGEWGGGVNPIFVQNMYDWLQDHDAILQAYFEHDTPSAAHSLSDEGDYDFGEASLAYRETFGGQSGLTDDTGDDSDPARSNYVFVTDSELQTQQERVDAGESPWSKAHKQLINDADAALGASLRSVTDDDGNHSFKSGTPGIERHDYKAAIDMSEYARDCALAYWFTNEDRYAERAVEVIHHWCLADSTYMKPTVNVVSSSSTIVQHITIPAFMYAASLVAGHSAWGSYDGTRPWDGGDSGDAESAFRQWVADRQDTFVETRPYKDSGDLCEYNNKWSWRIADRAASAAYLQDDEMMETAKCMWKGQCAVCNDGKQRPWNDFVNNYRDSRAYDGTADPANNGLFKHELHRSDGMGYTAYNFKAHLMALLVFERFDGTDLYDYNAPYDNKSGSTLWKALNWFDDYLQNIAAWEWDDGSVANRDIEEGASTYELAYAHWGEFRGAIDRPDSIGGRPHYDSRLLGHVTLTHGAE